MPRRTRTRRRGRRGAAPAMVRSQAALASRSRISHAVRRCSRRKASRDHPALQFVRVCEEGSRARGVEHFRSFRSLRSCDSSPVAKCRCALTARRPPLPHASRAPRPRPRRREPAPSARVRGCRYPWRRNGRRSYAARGRRVRRRCEDDAVFCRRAGERSPLAHSRDDVGDVLDRRLRAARQRVVLRETLGHPRALTAAAPLWYLSHAEVQKGAETVTRLGP